MAQFGHPPLRRFGAPVVRVLGLPLGGIAMWALRLTSRRVGVAVVYHSVAAESGDSRTELVAPHGAALFEAEMRHLARKYRVVAARVLPDAVAARRRGERFPAAVTFDDDLVSHVDLALPALRRTGITATFFLSGASLDRPFAFWWERLQRLVDADETRLPALFAAAGVSAPAAVTKNSIHELGRLVEDLQPDDRDAFAESLRGAGDPPDAGIRTDGRASSR